jgi:hypothetical protein
MRVSQLLFPDAPQVRVHDIVRTGSGLVIFASTRGAARCPHCRHRSKRVHSHYERLLSDVACGGCAVTVALRVRRLRCATPGCRTFGERLHHVVIPHVHRTVRATGLIVEEGFALGGRPGARAAKRLGLQVSKSTVLRVLRAQPLPPTGLVRRT